MSGPIYDWQADGVGYSVRCDRRGVPELFATLPGHADELLPAVLEELLSLAERWGAAKADIAEGWESAATWRAKAEALEAEASLRLRRCPACNDLEITWAEIVEHRLQYDQDADGIEPEGYQVVGDIVRVEGKCANCGHRWRARAGQIDDVPGYRRRS